MILQVVGTLNVFSVASPGSPAGFVIDSRIDDRKSVFLSPIYGM